MPSCIVVAARSVELMVIAEAFTKTQGANQIYAMEREMSRPVRFVFVQPPSIEARSPAPSPKTGPPNVLPEVLFTF